MGAAPRGSHGGSYRVSHGGSTWIRAQAGVVYLGYGCSVDIPKVAAWYHGVGNYGADIDMVHLWCMCSPEGLVLQRESGFVHPEDLDQREEEHLPNKGGVRPDSAFLLLVALPYVRTYSYLLTLGPMTYLLLLTTDVVTNDLLTTTLQLLAYLPWPRSPILSRRGWQALDPG